MQYISSENKNHILLETSKIYKGYVFWASSNVLARIAAAYNLYDWFGVICVI